MKELDTWDALQMAFEYYKKDSISIFELYQWIDKYQDKHPEVYLHICRDDIHHEHGCNRIWWEIRYNASDLLHRQESIECPICGETHFKFPNTKNFEKMKKLIKILNSIEVNLEDNIN